MPIYAYQCDCGHAAEEFQHITAAALTACPVCGSPAYHRVPTLCHTDLKEFHTPIDMYSVAVEDLGEVRDLKRACPDADISDNPADPMYGVPIARSRKAKLQVLRASGYIETNSERVRA